MTTAGARRCRTGNRAEGMESPRYERNSCRSLWTPARDTLKGTPGTRAGDLTEVGLNIMTALASTYLIGRIAFGLWQ